MLSPDSGLDSPVPRHSVSPFRIPLRAPCALLFNLYPCYPRNPRSSLSFVVRTNPDKTGQKPTPLPRILRHLKHLHPDTFHLSGSPCQPTARTLACCALMCACVQLRALACAKKNFSERTAQTAHDLWNLG